jgi:hypothetical protein
MIQLTLKSDITGRVIKKSYTARQLLESDEIEVVQEMSACDCQPIGETNVVECNCDDEWYDYTLIVGE